jgi:hypothetical protein
MTVFQRARQITLLLMATAVSGGCGGVSPVAGGTQGSLVFGDQLMSDIQVSVHQLEGSAWTRIGFGVTDREGRFELLTEGAKGPLWLPAGEFRFTLETAGAPYQIPQEYGQAETTPLKVSRSGEKDELQLKVASALALE